jgi:hypothetical protein
MSGKPDYLLRMEEEIKELGAKLVKLLAFVGSDNAKALPDAEYRALLDQSNAMEAYYRALSFRLLLVTSREAE